MPRWPFLVVAGQLALMGSALAFRVALYPRMPVARGDPYGLGDLIELGLYFAVAAGAGLNLLAAALSVVLVRPRRLGLTATLGACGLFSVPLYRLLHGAVA